MARNKHPVKAAPSGGASGAAQAAQAEPASPPDERTARLAKRAALTTDPDPEAKPPAKKAASAGHPPKPRGRPPKKPATHPPRPRGRPPKKPRAAEPQPEAQPDASAEPTPEPEQADAAPEQPAADAAPESAAEAAAAAETAAAEAAAAAEADEAQGSAGPASAPGTGRAKRRRSTRRLTHGEDENVVIDEQGNTVPVPPKHGTPAQHSRPKSGQGEPLQPAAGASMTLRFHARGENGAWGSPDAPPAGSLDTYPAATFAQLRQQISQACPGLNPRAQHFYRREADGSHTKLDPQGHGRETLASAGYGLPGPHDVFLEIDLQALLSTAGEVTVTAGPEEQTVLPAAAPTEAVAQQQQQQQHQEALAQPQPPAYDEEAEAALAQQQQQQQQQQQEVLALPAPANPTHRRGQGPGSRRARPNNRWNEWEVDNLLQGLMSFGTSAWTKIAERWQFQERTTIDLKDKWRNLKKNVRDGRPVRGAQLGEEKRALILRIMRENGEPDATAAPLPALPPPAEA